MGEDLHEQLRQAFLDKTSNVEELPETDPRKAVLRRMGNRFTAAVDFLRSQFPNESIRGLMALVWDLVGNRIVPLSHGPHVNSLSLVAIERKSKGSMMAAILTPDDWLERLARDITHETGAIVFVGSHAVDYYNGRLTDGHVCTRAWAYEAEYLLTIQRSLASKYKFNEYQKALLAEFPRGLATEKVVPLLYESKPFVMPSS